MLKYLLCLWVRAAQREQECAKGKISQIRTNTLGLHF